MLRITTSVAMQQAINAATDDALRFLLTSRMERFGSIDGYDLGEVAHFVVMGPGDSMSDVDTALGFSVLLNLVDQVPYGDPGFEPSWEWVSDHGDWYEIAFVLSDDGFGWIIFVPKAEGIDSRLLNLCAQHALPHGDCDQCGRG